MIAELINKQDNFEAIRDQLAAILALETANQQQLATAGGEDPELWRLRVFKERTSPWELFPGRWGDLTPVVNVWWDSSDFDEAASNVVARQKSVGTFNIDCLGYGQSQSDGQGGQILGDEAAALEAQRAARLVRNILMAGTYTYLDMQPLVWRRWLSSSTAMRPQQDDPNAHRLAAVRLAFRVGFNEDSPQVPAETLELLTAQVIRAEDGQVLVSAEYDYPNLET